MDRFLSLFGLECQGSLLLASGTGLRDQGSKCGDPGPRGPSPVEVKVGGVTQWTGDLSGVLARNLRDSKTYITSGQSRTCISGLLIDTTLALTCP